METELLIRKKKEIYASLVVFFDDTKKADIEPLIKKIEEKDFLKNKKESSSTLQLLSKIADNHHRLSNFIDKLGKIIHYIYIIQKIRSKTNNIMLFI